MASRRLTTPGTLRWAGLLLGLGLGGGLWGGAPEVLKLLARDPGSAVGQPDWLAQTPQKPGRRYFVGAAEKDSLAGAMEAAQQDAQRAAAEAAGVQVVSVLSAQATYQNGQSGEDVQARSRSVALAAIHELGVSDRYDEQWGPSKGRPTLFRAWVLASMPQGAFQAAVSQAVGHLAEMDAGRDGRLKAADAGVARAQELLRRGRRQAASGFEDQADTDWRSAQAELDVALACLQDDDPARVPELKNLQAQLGALLNGRSGQIGSFKAAVAVLAAAMKRTGVPAAVVRATYQDTPLGGPMGPRLIKLVEDALAQRAPGSVIPNRLFLDRLAGLHVPIEDLMGNLSTANAQALRLHSAVFIQYWDRQDALELSLTLLEPGLGAMLASARCTLPLDELPGGATGLKPPNLAVAEQALRALGLDSAGVSGQDDGIPVKVWPLRGESCTYVEGERLGFCVKLERPGYVYLIHADAAGKVQLLLPNRWQVAVRQEAGSVLLFPDKDAAFEFAAGPPAGADVVVAVATQRPLATLGVGDEDGFQDLGDADGHAVQAAMSEIASLPAAQRGISRCVYSTVAAR